MILSESTTKWLSTKIIDDMDIDEHDREEQFEFLPWIPRNELTWERVLFELWRYGDKEHDFEEYCELYVNGEVE